MAKKHTPVGVSLKELAQGFKNQGLDVPDHIKSILEEHGSTRAKIAAGISIKDPLERNRKPQEPRSATDSTPVAPHPPQKPPEAPKSGKLPPTRDASGRFVKTWNTEVPPGLTTEPAQRTYPADESQPPRTPTTSAPVPQTTPATPESPPKKRGRYSARRALGAFLSGAGLKGIAEKLKKGSHDEHVASEETLGYLRAIRLDIKDIKEHLSIHTDHVMKSLDDLNKKDEKRGLRPDEKYTWKRALSKSIEGATAGKVKITQWHHDTRKTEKVEKPEEIQALEHTTTKVSPQQAPQIIQNLRKTHESDQQEVAQDEATEKKEEQRKSIQDRLTHIEKVLKTMKNKSSGLMSILGAAIPAILAGLAFARKFLTNIMKTVGKIGWNLLKKIGKLIFKLGGRLMRGIGNAISNITSKVWNAVKGGWNKLKNLGKDIVKDGEAEVGEATEAGEAAEAGEAGMAAEGGLASSALLPAAAVAGAGAAGYAVGKGLDWATKKVTGKSLSERLSDDAWDLFHGKDAPQPTFNVSEYRKTHGLIARPANKAQAALHHATVEHVAQKQEDQTAPMPVIIKGGDTTKVVHAPQQQGLSSVIISTRNPESSLGRLTGMMYDDPAGWGALSRL